MQNALALRAPEKVAVLRPTRLIRISDPVRVQKEFLDDIPENKAGGSGQGFGPRCRYVHALSATGALADPARWGSAGADVGQEFWPLHVRERHLVRAQGIVAHVLLTLRQVRHVTDLLADEPRRRVPI